jgi:hypothetical protein
MPQRKDDNNMLIMNMIFERQIKKFIQLLYWPRINLFLSQDLFVIQASDPTVFLNYASVTGMNVTLEGIIDSVNLECWILIILDYLAFLHCRLDLVNLDIKP